MSLAVMSCVWSSPIESPVDRLVALVLADWSDEAGEVIDPCLSSIANRCRITPLELEQSILRLTGAGMLDSFETDHPGWAPSVRGFRLQLTRLTGDAEAG